MKLKKINSVCSWITSAALLSHALIMGFSLFTGWYNLSICKALAHSTAGMVCIHAVISIIIIMFYHDGTAFSKYAKFNKKTIIQRASCIVMTIILHMHISAFEFIVSGEILSLGGKIRIIITEIIFFASVFSHIAVSFGNSLITIGFIRKEKTLKAVQLISYIVCGLFMSFTMISLVVFTVSWTGFAG